MDEGGGVGVEDEVGAELEAGMDAVAERGVVGAEEGEGSGGFWGGGASRVKMLIQSAVSAQSR